MADTGAPHSLPYPIASDAPAGHTQMQALATQVATRLGFVGKSVIATTQSRTNVAFGKLTTADEVTGVVLPTDGWIVIGYQATWQESVANNAEAAIFIGTDQLKIASDAASAPSTQAAATGASTAAKDQPLASFAGGLASTQVGDLPGNPNYGGDVTTGQILGVKDGTSVFAGPCTVFAAAGTYTISVQFRSASGSVTVKNRRLWVRVLPF